MTGTTVPLRRGDWLLPAALAAASVAEVLTVDAVPRAAVPVLLLTCGLLVGRRRRPLVFATAAGLVLLVLSSRAGLPDDTLTVPLVLLFVACYSLGRHVASWWGAAAVLGLNLALHWSRGFVIPPLDDWLWAGTLIFGPYVAGRLVLGHARTSQALEAQAHQLVLEQRQVAERAVADERRRIARELHDVIAHSLSVMVVQAGAAREVLDTDRSTVARALEEIQRAGRSALDETGRLLGLLRKEAGPERAPQPVAGDLPDLVDGFRSSGLDARLSVQGATEGLPAGIDLSVYRIVEESLTNALKHAPGSSVEVRYRRDPGQVEVHVTSTAGVGVTSRLSSSGRGLAGMRERVTVFGGSFSAAPTGTGTFVVDARFPLPEPA